MVITRKEDDMKKREERREQPEDIKTTDFVEKEREKNWAKKRERPSTKSPSG